MPKQTTTPIQALRLALSYASFEDSDLAGAVTALLNEYECDIEELEQEANTKEPWSADTDEIIITITAKIADLISPNKEQEDVNDEAESEPS